MSWRFSLIALRMFLLLATCSISRNLCIYWALVRMIISLGNVGDRVVAIISATRFKTGGNDICKSDENENRSPCNPLYTT